MAGIQNMTPQGPPPESGPSDEIWKQSLTGAYQNELTRWSRADKWQRARIMANEDRRGTGDLFAEALKHYTPTGALPQVGGVQRLLSQFTGGNING